MNKNYEMRNMEVVEEATRTVQSVEDVFYKFMQSNPDLFVDEDGLSLEELADGEDIDYPEDEFVEVEWHMPEREDRDTCVFENFSQETMTPDDESVIKMARHKGCIGCSKYANDNCWASRVFAQTGRELMEDRGLDIIPRVIDKYKDIEGYDDIKEKYNKFLDIVSKDESFQTYDKMHKDAFSMRTCAYVNIDQMLQDPNYAVQMYNGKNCWCDKDKRKCFIHNFIEELAAIILTEVFGYDI